MTHTLTKDELKQAILTIIYNLGYCYLGKIDIVETFSNNKHLGYILKLGLNVEDKPFTIACEGNINTFLKFVEEELRKSSLHSISYFKGIQI